MEQRAGRTIRQGNKNKKVDIIRYVTEGTFDAYLYQVIENKQKFISQIMTSKSPARTVDDIDEVAYRFNRAYEKLDFGEGFTEWTAGQKLSYYRASILERRYYRGKKSKKNTYW